MVDKSQTSKYRYTDISLWVLIVAIVFCGNYLMFYYREQIAVFRLLFTFFGLAFVLAIASRTTQGVFVINYAQSSWVEMGKVIWPKPSEAKQISIVVLCAIVLITLALWLVDSVLTVTVRGLLG
ncbi:MAG: preprotein translocase subunit SecE [Pseudomonadota bacterium]|nr:preprotein translocase subunit SecE [Pseudomonadota bacterium]